MPIIQNSNLTSFERLRLENVPIIKDDSPSIQNSCLNIALINMMPDAALEATERQFLRLLGNAPQNIYFFPFAHSNIKRSARSTDYIQKHYFNLNQIKSMNLDALIISGANVPLGELSEAPFWNELATVFEWLLNHPKPTLFTCLATHSAIDYMYGQKRRLLEKKCWGVFQHKVKPNHPLTIGLPETVFVPHSRMNEISAEQMEQSGLEILIHSDDIGPHMAISREKPEFIFFQGHPEYDTISLLKEYKREIKNFVSGQQEYPHFPQNYFAPTTIEKLEKYRAILQQNRTSDTNFDRFPIQDILNDLPNTWHQSAQIVIKNWLNKFVTNMAT